MNVQRVNLQIAKVRTKRDIFGIPILGFLFKNKYMLTFYRLFTLFLLIYAIVYSFLNPGKENIFTNAVFWSIFWPFFMVITLPTLGNVFCMVCPHGFVGKYLTRYGLKLRMPKWLANPYIGLIGTNILAYWVVVYTFPGVFRTPWVTALFFFTFTLVAFIFFFLFRDMAYCKYICPIGAVNSSFSRVSPLWLSTYHEDCKKCKKPVCALACPYKLNPSKFDEKNSMFGCTLCMECAHACPSVKLEYRGFGSSLYKLIKHPKAVEIWVYILLVAVITFRLRFLIGISRSSIGEYMPWNVIGKSVSSSLGLPKWIDISGLIAMLMAIALVLSIVFVTFKAIANIIKVDFNKVLLTLGYAFAPLMIVGALSQVIVNFFTANYHNIVNGFSQAFSLGVHAEPLAKMGDRWLLIFRIFHFVAGFWTLHILWHRVKLLTQENRVKVYLLASALPVVYILLSVVTLVIRIIFPVN